jgi:L-lysine 6-transaminase
MVRAAQILTIIEEDHIVEHAAQVGAYLQQRLEELQGLYPDLISNVRGRGLMVAFDLPTKELRDKLVQDALDKENLLLLKAGERSIRSRSALTITEAEIDEGISRLERLLRTYSVKKNVVATL